MKSKPSLWEKIPNLKNYKIIILNLFANYIV